MPVVMPTRVKLLLVACTVAALAIFIGAYAANSDPSANSGCSQPKAVELLYPPCNTQAFQQAQVGVDMAPGYTVDLVVNGVPIPLDQIQNSAAQNTVEARVVPDIYLFAPGPDKALERLKPGPNTATVSYRKVGANEATRQSFTWGFTVN
jgi:hypothetical protein